MTLTLQTIKDHDPSTGVWKKLTKAIGSDLNTELSIGDILISNGLDDALWCLQCLAPRQRVAAIMPAVKRASVHTTDHRVHDCIAAVEQWLAGDDTVDLKAAARASAAAAWAAEAAWASGEGRAAQAAEAAAWAAWAAALASGEAREPRAAEWAAAGPATWAAEREAREAERKLQEADLLAMFPPMILEGEDDE